MQKTYLIISAIIVFSISSCTQDVPEVREPNSVLAVANAIDGSKVYPWVEQLTAFHLADSAISHENFPPGKLFPSEHLTRSSTVGYISYAFRQIGYNAEVLPLGDEPLVAYNVVAEHPGITRPEEVVLVAGHLDAFYGGADDNSSSIAAMLEISRAVKNFSFARTIRFVAFDLEEFGSIVSTRYIRGGHADDVKSAVVLDMIGYASGEPGSQKNVKGLRVPDVGDFIFVVGNQMSAELTQQVISLSNSALLAKTVGIITTNDGAYFLSSVFMRSDHGLLWYRGIPAVFFTDGGNFRNPHYHEPTDLPETLNKDFLIANTRLIAATVAILAEVQP